MIQLLTNLVFNFDHSTYTQPLRLGKTNNASQPLDLPRNQELVTFTKP